jgi:staphylococcal nuclease domain-containing protein 1
VSAAEGTCTVSYVDFGNSETISFTRVRPLDPKFTTLAPQAIEARLAFSSIPPLESDYGQEAYSHLKNLTENRSLQCLFLGKLDGKGTTEDVVLIDSTDSSIGSVQERMIRDGWAVVDKDTKRRYEEASKEKKGGNAFICAFDICATLLDAQELARKERLNIWRYGDYDDGSDDE